METTNRPVPAGPEAVRLIRKVREKYGRIARSEAPGGGGPASCAAEASAVAAAGGYTAEELAQVADANLGLGCGAPLAHLDPRPGEVVLDLGSGGGIDAFLAARCVGDAGRVIGVDMTPEMIARAREAAERRRLANVEFREGRLERLPVDTASVDAVTSNCVINLVPDKAAVFAEVSRVLRPGGRLVISDIVLDGVLSDAAATVVLAYVGCVSGAPQRGDYFSLVERGGLGGVEILRDVDYLAGLKGAAPEETDKLLARTGVRWTEVEGRVRSVTFRARKP